MTRERILQTKLLSMGNIFSASTILRLTNLNCPFVSFNISDNLKIVVTLLMLGSFVLRQASQIDKEDQNGASRPVKAAL